MAVGPLTGVADSIVQFVDWGITILVIMIAVEIIRFVFHGSEVASAGEGGKRLFGWAKGKWGEGQQKTKKLAAREREFDLLEYKREIDELKLEGEIAKEVEKINVDKIYLEGRAIAADPDVPHRFEQLAGLTIDVTKKFKEFGDRWRGIRRTALKHERAFKQLIAELRKDQTVTPLEVDKLIVLDRNVLKTHNSIETVSVQLNDKLKQLASAAERAFKLVTPSGSTGGVDLVSAQRTLQKADFQTAPALAQKLVDLQKESVKFIAALIAEIEKNQ